MESLQYCLSALWPNPYLAVVRPGHLALAVERKAELSLGEMRAILASRVLALYDMTVGEYVAARKAGALPRVAGGTALAVFSGEAGATPSRGS